MRFRTKYLFIGFCLVLVSVLLAGCEPKSEGDPPHPNYDVLMNAGKAALEIGDGYKANGYFVEAARVRPGDAQANLGIGISSFLQIMMFADEAVDFAGAFAGASAAPSGTQKSAPNPNAWKPVGKGTGDVVDMFVRQIMDSIAENMVAAMDIAKSDTAIDFKVGTIPIFFQGQTILSLHGNWDHADVYFFDGIVRAFQAGIDSLLSVNMNFDFTYAMDILSRDFSTMTTQETLRFIIHQVNLLVADPKFPDFLLSTADAKWRMPRAGIDLGYLFADWVEAIQTVKDPTGPLGYVVVDDNGIHDAFEPLFFGSIPALPDSIMNVMPQLLAIMQAASASLWDGTPEDVNPNADNEFDLALLNGLWSDSPLGMLIKLPATPIDLGAVFTNPDPKAFKDLLVNSLQCLDKDQGPFMTIGCLLQ